MDTNKILSGAIVWSVGLLVPMLYHALLMHAAVQEEGYGYSYHSMVKYFFHLPWIVWPYLIGIAVVGSILIISGLTKRDG